MGPDKASQGVNGQWQHRYYLYSAWIRSEVTLFAGLYLYSFAELSPRQSLVTLYAHQLGFIPDLHDLASRRFFCFLIQTLSPLPRPRGTSCHYGYLNTDCVYIVPLYAIVLFCEPLRELTLQFRPETRAAAAVHEYVREKEDSFTPCVGDVCLQYARTCEKRLRFPVAGGAAVFCRVRICVV